MTSFLRRLFGTRSRHLQREHPRPVKDGTILGTETTRSKPHVVPIHEDAFGKSHPFAEEAKPHGDAVSVWSNGQRVLDEYIVEESICDGGMGMVYRVRSESTGQRFAAKHARLRTTGQLRGFLMEIQTWIDLPEYPHIATCRFYRTVGEEVVLFSEYVEAGTLGNWIRDHKLTTLESILDVAIQLAWALDALHRLQLIHQDVKPHNVLMTVDGIVKLADFGLARAQATTSSTPSLQNQSPGTSFCGMTPAYCSPEQARFYRDLHRGIAPHQCGRLTEQTDIWSFGLCVLEMFFGERTWNDGTEGRHAFERRRHVFERANSLLPCIPDEVVEVLCQCLAEDPLQRPETMASVADLLRQAYQHNIGRPYPRSQPILPTQLGPGAEVFQRVIHSDLHYPNPVIWLHIAFREARRNTDKLKSFVESKSHSRRGAVASDLALFHESRQIFENLIAQGRTDLDPLYAECCSAEALVREHADDLPGALRLFDQALLIYERAIQHQDSHVSLFLVGEVYMNKAVAVSVTNDLTAAVELTDLAISTYETLVKQDSSNECIRYLASAYLNKGIFVRRQGNMKDALALHDKASHLLSELSKHDRSIKVACLFAKSLMNKGVVFRCWKNMDAAKQATEEAIQIFEHLVNKYQQAELTEMLASTHENLGIILHEAKDYQAALLAYNKALAIRERLVNEVGLWELADKLAGTYGNKAVTAGRFGKQNEAVTLQKRAIAIYEKLVHEYGRLDIENDLARSYQNLAVDCQRLGENQDALKLLDKAIEIRERMVQVIPTIEIRVGLGNVYVNKANSLRDSGQKEAAVALYDRSIAIWTELIEQEGHAEMEGSLLITLLNKQMAVDNLSKAEVIESAAHTRTSKPQNAMPTVPVIAYDEDREAHRHVELAARLCDKGSYAGAISHCDKAIAIFEQLCRNGERPDLIPALALTYGNKGINYSLLENLPAATEQLDRGIVLCEQAVNREPKWENRAVLAKAYMNKAVVLTKQAEIAAAVTLYDRAIEMLDRIVFPEGHRDWLSTLGRCHAGRSQSLFELGRREEAGTQLRETIKLLEAERARSDQQNIRDVLNWAYRLMKTMQQSKPLN